MEDAYPRARPTPLDLPQAISYRNHQKSLAYFSHLAPLFLFFFLKDGVKSRVGVSESWESKFFLGVGVEKLRLPESRVGVKVEKICLPESRVGIEKICLTLTLNLSQEWKAFHAMNKLPKYTVGLSKSRPVVFFLARVCESESRFFWGVRIGVKKLCLPESGVEQKKKRSRTKKCLRVRIVSILLRLANPALKREGGAWPNAPLNMLLAWARVAINHYCKKMD